MTYRPHVNELEYYSVFRDDDVVRLSIANERGQEYFAIVSCSGRDWKQRKDAAVDKLFEAMKRQEPGEVVL